MRKCPEGPAKTYPLTELIRFQDHWRPHIDISGTYYTRRFHTYQALGNDSIDMRPHRSLLDQMWLQKINKNRAISRLSWRVFCHAAIKTSKRIWVNNAKSWWSFLNFHLAVSKVVFMLAAIWLLTFQSAFLIGYWGYCVGGRTAWPGIISIAERQM